MAKPVYYSINGLETNLLEIAPFEEVGLYLILKRLADFKTGSIGKHPQSKTNCQKLAEKLSRPPSQGRAAVVYDRKDIDRILTRMQLRGLVIREPYDDDNIVLTLPLSPIKPATQVATSKPSVSKVSQGKLPQKATDISPQSFDYVEPETIYHSPSVLINTDNTINNINTSSNEGYDSWDSDDPPTLNLEVIKSIMDSREAMLYVNSNTSIAIYKGWIKAGISKDDLIKAIETAEEELTLSQTPNDVDQVLRSTRKQSNNRVATLHL